MNEKHEKKDLLYPSNRKDTPAQDRKTGSPESRKQGDPQNKSQNQAH